MSFADSRNDLSFIMGGAKFPIVDVVSVRMAMHAKGTWL